MHIGFLFCWATAHAQSNGKLLEQSLDIHIPFTITQYSSKHGLPQSQVLSITPQKNGNLALSTSNGIVEFNGFEFKPIVKDEIYRAHQYSKLFYHGSSNNLFGEELDGPFYTLYPEYKKIRDSRASCMQNDSIYCINNVGEIYSAHVIALHFKKIAETGIKKPVCLIASNNIFLVGNGISVFKYDRNKKTNSVLLNEEVIDFKIDPYNGAIYMICPNNVYKETKSGLENVWRSNERQKNVRCNDIDFTDDSTFYLATTQGLLRVSGNKIIHENGLPSEYIQSLYYNKYENILFVGTGDRGLLKLQFKNCYSYTSAEGFNENPSLCSVIQTKSGDILTAVIEGVIYKIGKDTVYPYSPLKELYSSLTDINDTIYAGTWGGGVKVISNKKIISTLSHPRNLVTGFVHTVFRDSRNNIWVGGDGLSKGTKLENIVPYLKNKKHTGITIIYELKNKNICIGGTNGVYILNHQGYIIKHLGKTQGMKGKEVRSLYEDEEGKLWIGTYGGGLYCYYNEKVTSINQLKNCRLNEDVFCLAKDNLGYLYITSNHGLWRLKEKSLNDFYHGKINYLIPFYYGEETGILNTEFSSGFQNHFLKTEKGEFYFPSIQGVVLVKPEKPYFKKLIPVFDKLFVDDTLSSFTNKLLDRKTYSIQFDFSTSSFLAKYNVYYQYKLQSSGNDEWSPLQKNTTVSFKMLPPNKYTFYLRALDASMDSAPREIKFEFEIKPYFYETTWFKITFISIFILLSLIIGRIIINRHRKKAKEEERIKRELAELELKAVQAQMNPHFIFNCLNSIKHYLFINDTKSADIFIDNFSLLLRDFLEYSSKDFITMEKEADMLTSYLSLESMRMNPPFQYSITLPEALNKIKIPTLLFQPFVENAVKHGITHSEKKCSLDIKFHLKDNTVVCEIKDDGVGRNRSAKINKNQTYHTSKGVDLVNEKINIIRATYNILVEFEIIDRKDIYNNPTGTDVIIKIPLKNDV